MTPRPRTGAHAPAICAALSLGLAPLTSPCAADVAAPQQTFLRESATRERCCLNGDWDFVPDGDAGLLFPPLADAWRGDRVRVPSWWSDAAGHGYPEAWRSVQTAWYRRRFEVPASWAGTRIVLRFDAVSYRARVQVNGRYAGEHAGVFTPFEIDVTDLVRPGSVNELVVGVRGPGEAVVNGRKTAPISEVGWAGIWQDVHLLRRPAAHIADVFVKTSVRSHEITADLTVANRSRSGLRLTATADVVGLTGDRSLLRLPAAAKTFGPGASAALSTKAAWPRPHLWSPEDPYLYRLRVRLFDGQRLADERYVRFGFREFWIDGDHFMLNGVRINLRGDSVNRMPGAYVFLPQYVRAFFEEARRNHINIVRLHPQPFPPIWFDIADEVGMLMIDEGMMSRPDLSDLSPFRQHYEEWVRRDRDHPSIVLWSVANEANMKGDKEAVKPLKELADLVAALDPTRPWYFEGDGDEAGQAPICDYHYPHEPPQYIAFPDTAYWLAEHPDQTWYPAQWDGKKPLTVGEFTPLFYASPDDVSAFGDDVYRDIFGDQAGYYQALADCVGVEIEGLRASGAAMIKPWATVGAYAYRWFQMRAPLTWSDDEITQPGYHPRYAAGHYSMTLNPGFDPGQPLARPLAVQAAISRAFTPVAAFVRERTRCVFGGRRATRMVTMHNDVPTKSSLELRWRLGDASESRRRLTLDPGARKTLSISVTPPAVRERTTMALTWRLLRDGVEVFRDLQVWSVFPDFKAASMTDPAQIYDPTGTTALMLRGLGVPFRLLADPAEAQPGLIVVGAGAVDAKVRAAARHLHDLVVAGSRLICFEQDSPFDWLPAPLELAAGGFTMANVRAPHHPALAGVERDDLRFWSRDGMVARRPFVKPQHGSYRFLVDGGNLMASLGMAEARYGRGSMVLSQLALVEKWRDDPIARRIACNLLAPWPPEDKPHLGVGVIDADKPWPDAPVPELRDSTERGATHLVVVTSLTDLDWLSELIGHPLVFRTSALRHWQLELASDDPLLDGISPRDLCFLTPDPPQPRLVVADWPGGEALIVEPQWTAQWRKGCGGDLMQFLHASAQSIERPGAALVRWRIGRGQVIVCTIGLREADRFHNQLFCNLGGAFPDPWQPSAGAGLGEEIIIQF